MLNIVYIYVIIKKGVLDMTSTEKYLMMNNEFCKLRDAIYESDVDEEPEDDRIQKSVEMALGVLCQYLDYYKDLNGCKTHAKK